MKKYVAVLMVMVIMLSVSACGIISGGTQKDAEKVFVNLKNSYDMVNDLSEDIMLAWELGINDTDELKGYTSYSYSYFSYSDSRYDYEKGLKYLAEKLNISENDICKGVAKAYYGTVDSEAITISEAAELYETLLNRYSNVFSACMNIVISTYEANGKIGQIDALISVCRDEMKDFSKKSSDYEHYPDLKSYYVNMMAFYDFCKSPVGTYDTATDTVNNYRSTEKTYYYSLYCFLDEAFGTSTTTVPTTVAT